MPRFEVGRHLSSDIRADNTITRIALSVNEEGDGDIYVYHKTNDESWADSSQFMATNRSYDGLLSFAKYLDDAIGRELGISDLVQNMLEGKQ